MPEETMELRRATVDRLARFMAEADGIREMLRAEKPELAAELERPIGKLAHGGIVGSAHPIAIEDLVRAERR